MCDWSVSRTPRRDCKSRHSTRISIVGICCLRREMQVSSLNKKQKNTLFSRGSPSLAYGIAAEQVQCQMEIAAVSKTYREWGTAEKLLGGGSTATDLWNVSSATASSICWHHHSLPAAQILTKAGVISYPRFVCTGSLPFTAPLTPPASVKSPQLSHVIHSWSSKYKRNILLCGTSNKCIKLKQQEKLLCKASLTLYFSQYIPCGNACNILLIQVNSPMKTAKDRTGTCNRGLCTWFL